MPPSRSRVRIFRLRLHRTVCNPCLTPLCTSRCAGLQRNRLAINHSDPIPMPHLNAASLVVSYGAKARGRSADRPICFTAFVHLAFPLLPRHTGEVCILGAGLRCGGPCAAPADSKGHGPAASVCLLQPLRPGCFLPRHGSLCKGLGGACCLPALGLPAPSQAQQDRLQLPDGGPDEEPVPEPGR